MLLSSSLFRKKLQGMLAEVPRADETIPGVLREGVLNLFVVVVVVLTRHRCLAI